MVEDEIAGRILIRRFKPADYSRIMNLWQEAGLPAKPSGRDSREEIERQTGLDNVAFLVADSGKNIVGTVVASHDGRKGWINRLAVDPAFRNRGVARQLVEASEAWFETCGLGIFACLIEAWNEDSMRFFEKAGYEKHAEIIYFTKRKHPDV